MIALMAKEHRVIEDIVRNRTREGINPYISHFDLVGRAGRYGGLGTENAAYLIDNMVKTDHLFQWPPSVDPLDDDVDWQEVYLTLPDVDRLQRWARAEAESDGETDTELIGELYTTISKLEEDDSDE